MSALVGVLASLYRAEERLYALASAQTNESTADDYDQLANGLQAASTTVAKLIEAATRVERSLSVKGFVKPSAKNPNSGFVDMRDWFALEGEVKAVRDALSRVGGAA